MSDRTEESAGRYTPKPSDGVGPGGATDWPTTKTDPKLIADLASPDPIQRDRAWLRFERIYTPLLLFWARDLGHRGQDAEDLVQEVKAIFLGKAKAFEYDPKGRFRGLLRRILENKGSELARRRRRDSASELPESVAGAADGGGVAGNRQGKGFDLDNAWQLEALREAIMVVRNDYQTNPKKNPLTFRVFELRVLEGLSGEKVGEMLGIRRSAVDKYKSRVAAEVAEAVRVLAEMYG